MRRFELGRRDPSRRLPWLTSAALHVTLAVLAITVAWQAPFRPRRGQQPEVREWVVLPPVDGPRPGPSAAAASSARRLMIVPAPLPTSREPLDVPLRTPTGLARAGGPLVVGPQLGDGRAWAPPRPALPADAAEALYGGDTATRDTRAARRLYAMLDSLNQVIDAEQMARRRPAWGTDVGGIPFRLDSQYINIAGIKIPTMALAMLGNLLPPGNYDETRHARQFEEMRQDLLRAALRTETFRDFQKYVRELRARSQAERDSSRARVTPPPDTTRVIP